MLTVLAAPMGVTAKLSFYKLLQGGQDAHQSFDALQLLEMLRGAHHSAGLSTCSSSAATACLNAVELIPAMYRRAPTSRPDKTSGTS